MDIKEPLKETTSNSRLVIKKDIASFKPALQYFVIYHLLRFALWIFWGLFFYDIFIEDLNLMDSINDSWYFAPIVTFIIILLTFTFWIAIGDFKSKRWFNKETGFFMLPEIKDEQIKSVNKGSKKVKRRKKKKKRNRRVIRGEDIINIDHFQLLTYSKKIRIPTKYGSSAGLADIFELNLVMKDQNRYNVCAYKSEKKAKRTMERLGQFLKKPTKGVY